MVGQSLTLLLLFAGTGAAKIDFAREIQPIFQKKCVACHGAAVQMNGLRLDEGAAALKGGYSGAAIVPKSSSQSKLVERVSSTKKGVMMPPAGPPVSEAEVAALKLWIDEGAEWPASAKIASGVRKGPDLWSFQPIRKPAAPAATNTKWATTAIDQFILARLEKEGVAPSPEADRTTLLRRLSLDLTGLPPTPAETAEFLADQRPDAYERQVERLLDSQHYGERWARQWLDLAHYADSDGYEKDQARQYAWRYRHWLIQALNRDVPFDRFTREQLAGDLIPNHNVDQVVATGFLRNTLTNREAGVDREEARFEQLVNRTNTVGTTWLGLAVGCAQCHDHKYDPILQRDYYSLLAFFDHSEEQDVDAPLPGEVGPYMAALPEYRAQRKELLKQYEVPALMPLWEEKMRMAIDAPGSQPEWDFALTSMKVMFDRTVKILKTEPARRDPRDQHRLENYFVNSFTSYGLDKDKMEKLKDLRPKLKALDDKLPPFAQAYAMRHDPDVQQSHLRVRGDWKVKGIPVEPAMLSQLPAWKGQGTPTRLDLANWLVSRENPLTARVWVNRAWQEFFGRGLVKTAEDFGKQGEAPTHPELLDWLASEFMDSGWSMKAMHRKIVMSAAYRQESKVRPELEARDPENTMIARQSRVRLSAESVRDATLAASGLLDDSIGGRSVKPPQPAGIAELGYGSSNKWVTSSGKDKYRRGLYIHFQRTTPYPMLMSFDSPDGSVACTRRSRSNTALQALNLLNDEVFFEAAKGLAWRLEREAPASVNGKIDYAFRLCLGRAPNDRERERLARFHDEQAQIFASEAQNLSAWIGVSRVILNLDEFITRE